MTLDSANPFQNSKLRILIPTLMATYGSIDIRAILIRSGINEPWHCAFLKIRFIKDSVTKLESKNKDKIKRFGKIDYNNFKVILESRSSNEMLPFLDSLQRMHIILKSIDTDIRLIPTDYQEIYSNEKHFGVYPYYTDEIECDGYVNKAILIDTNETPLEAITKTVKLDEYNLEQQDLIRYLDVQSLSHSNHNGILYFPYYCSIQKITEKYKRRYYSIVKIHRALIADSEAIIRSQDSKSQFDLNQCLERASDDGLACVYIPLTSIQIGSSLKIKIEHKVLGTLAEADRPVEFEDSKTNSGFPTYSLEDYLKMPIRKLVKMEESHNLEFKPRLVLEDRNRKLNKIQVEILQDIASFMNTPNGGILVMGIKNDKTICGIDDDFKVFPSKNQNYDNWNRHLYNLIHSHLGKYFSQYIIMDPIQDKKKTLVRVSVTMASKPVFLHYIDPVNGLEKNEFYIRSGSQSIPLIGNDINEYCHEHWST